MARNCSLAWSLNVGMTSKKQLGFITVVKTTGSVWKTTPLVHCKKALIYCARCSAEPDMHLRLLSGFIVQLSS